MIFRPFRDKQQDVVLVEIRRLLADCGIDQPHVLLVAKIDGAELKRAALATVGDLHLRKIITKGFINTP